MPDTPEKYYQLWRSVISRFKTGSVRQREDILFVVIMLAFHHPLSGTTLKEQVARSIRDKNRAQIVVNISKEGHLAIALADKFVDLDDLQKLAGANLQQPIVISRDDGPDEIRH